MSNSTITIVSYGKEKEWNKNNALKFYTEARAACEGHEAERYQYIIDCIKAGDTYIDDDEV